MIVRGFFKKHQNKSVAIKKGIHISRYMYAFSFIEIIVPVYLQ